MRYASICILICCFTISTKAQYQLVVVKKNDVVLRFDQGSDFVYKLKGDKKKKTSFIRTIKQDTVFLWRDTVLVHELVAIYEDRRRFHNTVGHFLARAGIVYFLADQINNTLVAGNSPSIDNNVALVSTGLLVTGVPLIFINRKIHRKGRKFRYVTTSPGSPFYLSTFN